MPAVRILIAEDEALPRMGLRDMLEEGGYDVVGEASDGQQAVEMARALRPDVVVMDLKMPNLDGIDASLILTEEQVAPVVIVTAYTDRELLERATNAGVFAYVAKPFTEVQLLPQIAIARARFAEFQALVGEVGQAHGALDARRSIERAKGLLMETLGISEPDAYRHLQQLSMNQRRPMRDIAEEFLTRWRDSRRSP